MKKTEKIYDITTGEETIVERDETAAETKERLDQAKAALDFAAAETQKAADRSALLTQLGITEQQAQLLIG